MIRETLIALAATALIGGPAYAGATKAQPGHSESAPGQRAQQPGAKDAKDYAPGQRMHKKDDPSSPGASEYAPGQQPKSPTNKQ